MNLTESINAFDKALEGLKEWHRSASDLFHPPTSGEPEVLSVCPRITDGTSTLPMHSLKDLPVVDFGEVWAKPLSGGPMFQVQLADLIKVRHPNGQVFLGRYLPDNGIEMFSHLQQF